MATLVVKSNASQGSDVVINDVGILIAQSGASVTFTEPDEIALLQQSDDLRAYLVDDAHGGGSSTLILNDGTGDVAQADAGQFLDIVLIPASGNFSAVQRNDAGQVDVNVVFDGTATVSSLTLGNDLDANSQKITGLAAPTANDDAATKQYVDDRAAGIDWKESCRLATDAALPAFTASGSGVGKTLTADANGTLTVDGVLTALNDRILVKDEASSDNGIYYVSQLGVVSTTPYILTRALDADTDAEMTSGVATFVTEGTTNGDTGWVLSTNDTITLDTTTLAFTQFSGGASVTPGAGLVLNGNAFDMASGAGTLTITADNVEVAYGLVAAITNVGAADAAGTDNTAARADHVHAHGDRGADGAVSHHDGQQVDVTGSYTNISSPGNVETAVSNINTNFGASQYVGKFLQFGTSNRIPSSGTGYLLAAGGVATSAVGVRMLRSGTITSASIQVDTAEATSVYKLSIEKNGTEVASVSLAATNTGAHSTALSQTYVAGDTLSVAIVRTSGSGFSTFDSAIGLVELNES